MLRHGLHRRQFRGRNPEVIPQLASLVDLFGKVKRQPLKAEGHSKRGTRLQHGGLEVPDLLRRGLHAVVEVRRIETKADNKIRNFHAYP